MVCMRNIAKGVGRMSEDAGVLPECEVIHCRHPNSPPSRFAALGMVEPELFGLTG